MSDQQFTDIVDTISKVIDGAGVVVVVVGLLIATGVFALALGLSLLRPRAC